MKNILLAADGSTHAVNATKEVVKLSKGFPDIHVTVISVVDSSETKSAALDLKSNKELLHMKRLKKIEETLNRLENAKIDYQVALLHGDPGPSIIKYASEHPTDLLVLGSRGLNSLQEMVMGSVSHKIVKQAACPVLVVK
ncbi:universal stress protein [Listeria newyorkensis]|uniref:Universal stress protein n=1 Tax=Listeria newyorkensis TaxID=1497681 RepID=A0ABX4XNZ2_9LIST|nr:MULTISPECIES: universal stress protein [Listeria]KGL45271.1 universal stress protein [Listeriaceae bacterium FSL A5-0209]KGL40165.1 universal stress protein [Listeria newyorkensis]KMT63412.1 Universal stress protein [Listeria newyorkensis]PNP93443.1 universal stress protein [Listeria newyorkensis]RQW68097.1 universal stress protein [Listeria sp. SHR_NRA_18]